MRPAIRRTLKYNKKLDPNVVENRVEALKTKQLSNYNVSMAKQMQLDTWIKSLGMGMNEVYYIIFAKQIDKLIGKYKRDILGEEVAGKKDLWVTRGLSSDILDEIISRFNIILLTPPPAWLGNFNYRREVTVNNGGGVLSNFQIEIELNSTNFDFTHAESDGKDIRITKADKFTKLDYWIESWDSSGQTAKVWVEANSLAGSGDTSLYLYYGDNTVISESNGDNTFEFFDDFEGTNLNSDKWDTVGTPSISISNSILSMTCDAAEYIESKTFTQSPPIILEVKSKDKDSSKNYPATYGFGKYHGTTYDTNGVRKVICTTAQYNLMVDDNSGRDYSTGVDRNTNFAKYKIEWTTSICHIYEDGVKKDSDDVTTYIPTTALKVNIGRTYFNEGNTFDIDWTLVRKYASPEPTNGLGSEESKP